MATLLLRSAGAAIGTALGGPLGGLIGGALGAVGGAVVDTLLINALTSRKSRAAQLDAINITNSTEGTPVRKLWGRMRLGGNVIWCTQFNTFTTKEKTASSSGKGFGGSTKTTVTHYTLSFAVAFCEGGDSVQLGRVWADGNTLDLSQVSYAFYNGSENQLPDAFMESVEGTGFVPAYRGTAYLVFYSLNLDAFGNRMPQISAEIIRTPPIPDPDDLTNLLRSVALLPGAGEFVLNTTIVKSSDGFGNWFPENEHTPLGASDIQVSLLQLDETLPNRAAVSLIVTWFGTDLRAGACTITPKVETHIKTVTPSTAEWSVAGFTRATAPLVSQIDPASLDPTGLAGSAPPTGLVPAFGGTPSDSSVLEAIADMKGRGLRVMFYPFVMMDIPAGNGLPDPYGGAEQAAYPWRGRITCFPGPSQAGTVDKTAAAADQIDAFFAQYHAMVTHYANLCVSAGGVDSFIIGSELVGLTQVRSSSGDGTYPAVQALKALAATVKGIVGPACRVGYAADWTEYHSHRPGDGSHDVIFNMDPLWSDPNIDFIGIDNYLPMSDWRDGVPNIDADPVTGPFTIYDKAYLARNIEGGEDYDWYYASAADRLSQTRTPIVDTAYAEHWVFRQKDIRSWWSNPHRSRPGGVHASGATGYAAQGKPIWFTEFGCPAVDKGPNQPNVFYDPKSSESALPYFSRGSKDDPVQRAYLETMLAYWRDNAPTSPVYGGPMLTTDNMFAWAWDARPFPDFPGRTAVWHDTPNYELGHWLTGRAGEVPLKWIIAELCAVVGVTAFDTADLLSASTLVLGYATDSIASPRDMLAGLMDAFQFDARESGGRIEFLAKGNVRVTALTDADLVIDGDTDPGYSFTRASDTDLPGAVRLSFADPFRAYASAGVESRKAIGNSQNVAQVSTAAALDGAYAADVAASVLQQTWAARETGAIKVPPSRLSLDAGDAVTVTVDGVTLAFRIKSVETTTYRALDLVGFDPSLLVVGSPPVGQPGAPRIGAFGPPVIEFMELPPVTGQEAEIWAPRIAAYGNPWAGIDVYRANGGDGWTYVSTVETPAIMGELTSPLYAGPVDRWDRGNVVYVRFYGSANLLTLAEAQVLAGGGAIGVKNADGTWEVLQYQNATLTGQNSYALSKLLRSQLGTEGAMRNPVATGARVVVLDANTLTPLDMVLDNRSLAQNLRYGPSLYPVTDASYTETTMQGAPVGLRPFSVSQIAGTRLSSGDVAFTWQRRTRFAGDSWDAATVPLNEDVEAYDVEVLSGGAVIRTVSGLPSPDWTYPAAQQAADFGGLQTVYTLNVYQLSVLYGRGQVATRTVYC
ncbi:baseplate multidomain protein megatron [Lichenifustis flavocetrariae]|uniref:Glycoside hydrolase/phage tail family protein n=1 Tax=Lichenifustis flavocetrariae TaxID=2949735 RepID=A0AA41YYN0_9HYPH|nr:glycoside hydrolase/phage tail family protein [Lichenifustis flavocetrariae]MCW6510994.1 glycoside hydrolase/phage tail family protein [Lichenifustis flavocetrariae]